MVTPPWMSQLQRDGFVRLPGVIEAEVAARLAMLALGSLDDHASSDDLVRTADGAPAKLIYPLDKYDEFVSVLGSQPVREVVDVLLPAEDSVLTWEDVLIKPPSVAVEATVHQDTGLDPTRDTVHSLGLSLAADGDNAVYFLPGSHRLGLLTKSAVDVLWADCRDLFQAVATQPGDVVIHNAHVLHHSGTNRSPKPRATWRLEFRSMRSLLENGPWDSDWVHRRRAIWVYARVIAGDRIGADEIEPVDAALKQLNGGCGTLRVPHVTDTVRYDISSPYNHFSDRDHDWRQYAVSDDGTHHVREGRPAYDRRFAEVLKFHAPGLAPVVDHIGAYHIHPDGRAAYVERHNRTFGFYEEIAAVDSAQGWHHIRPDGTPLYSQRYQWCGNFQEGRCPVRDADGRYFHIRADGAPAYPERYRYAGDFRDGHAVVQNDAGDHTHINPDGALLHDQLFNDLDVFHKRFARASDSRGWHHVDTAGRPLYVNRFRLVEPFYNGQARVEGHDGSLVVIDEVGNQILQIRDPKSSPLESLSADMVGVWRTQAIRAAVELGVFELLPATAATIEHVLDLAPSNGVRLMRALLELDLVRRDDLGLYHLTEKGTHLRTGDDLSLADAAMHWGDVSDRAWRGLVGSLRTGSPTLCDAGTDFFARLDAQPERLASTHRAFAAYARHDYATLPQVWDFGIHDTILDAGGGTGELAFALLRNNPHLNAIVMDRPEVAALFDAPRDVGDRCRFVSGNLFRRWPTPSDAVVLSRVLHDWADADARRILERAREAMPAGGSLYVVEMIPDEFTGSGGLLDLNMLVMTGGRERTVNEFKELLAEAGFVLRRVVPTQTVNNLMVAEAL